VGVRLGPYEIQALIGARASGRRPRVVLAEGAGPQRCGPCCVPGARCGAQFDKSVTVLKLRAARERIRRREGRCEGRKPFGARPAEAAALERIRQLRRDPRGGARLSVAAIAAQLNVEGVPTRQGGPWRPSSVYAILQRR
jgi:hypothetical protein